MFLERRRAANFAAVMLQLRSSASSLRISRPITTGNMWTAGFTIGRVHDIIRRGRRF